MKHSWIGIALGIAAGFVCLTAGAETVDAIVATVGTEAILQSELMQEIAPALNELRRTAKSQEEFDNQAEAQLRSALDQAIESKLLLREALLAGLDIRDEAVEERINEIKKRFASNEEFQRELEAAGETMSDFRARVRKQIMAISMGMRKRRELEKSVEVSEADVAKYYDENRGKFEHSERIRARRIFLEAANDAGARAQAKARMEEIKKQLDAGADFAELAKSFSTGPDAAAGGLVGWVARGDLVKNLEDAAFALPEGGVTDILETEFGLVILKVEKKEAAGTATLDEVRTEIEPPIRAKYAAEKYAKWMEELRKRGRVRTFIANL